MASLAAAHRSKILAAEAAAREQAAAEAAAPKVPETPAPPMALILAAEPASPAFASAELPRQSLAALHRQQHLARAAVERAGAEGFAPERPSDGAEATEYELLLAALGEDMRRLQDIQSLEKKIAAKAEMVAAYDAHVDAMLAASVETGKAVQDEVLVTMMLWHIDIGDYHRGLDIADHVLRYGLRLPERFLRTAATVVTEEIAKAAIAAQGQGTSFPLLPLQRVQQMTADADMPDIVRAKLHKALGFHLLHFADAQEGAESGAGNPRAFREEALRNFQRALALESKIGVKKDIERLEAALKKSALETPPQV